MRGSRPGARRAARLALAAACLAITLVACGGAATPNAHAGPAAAVRGLVAAARLPTGVLLDPAGAAVDVGDMPLAIALAPARDRYVLLLCGWREQGVQVVDRRTGEIVQTLRQPAAFVGLAFSPDGRTLYASGGDRDVVYRYAWAGDSARLRDSVVLGARDERHGGRRYPAGIAPSPDGRWLYVAEDLGDSLAVVDVATGVVTQRLPVGRYPYGVAVAPDGARVFVSAWGAEHVAAFRVAPDGRLAPDGRIAAGRHPSALLIDPAGRRLFVASASTDRIAAVDTRTDSVVAWLADPPPAGPDEGTTPNALALSADGTRLFAAEADANAIAVFDLGPRSSGIARAAGGDTLVARVPTAWYPSGVLALGDTLVALAAKGHAPRANPNGPDPAHGRQRHPESYTLGQFRGIISTIDVARASPGQLAPYTARVERANGWNRTPTAAHYPPITHVVYVIKENRTYDQVLGDLPAGDGDTALVFFPRADSPNHHALAERFGLFDRFFVNAEVSADGHNWSTAAYATDYLEKTVPSRYSDRGRTYDYEGANRDTLTDDDVNEPARGYLWTAAERAGIAYVNFGEYVVEPHGAHAAADDSGAAPRYIATKPDLERHTIADFPGFDLSIPDQLRADIFLRELGAWTRARTMPALAIVRLPNDHTSGLRAGAPTPRAAMGDNDLALGRIVEALSRSPFWRSTALFVVEDDAQNGPDHVDSHRSVLLVISPWAAGGVVHRFVNTTDVLATMADLLGLEKLSQFDDFGRPLREIWRTTPDPRPYTARVPAVSLDERNPSTGEGARESRRLDLSAEDRADEALFNRILWRAIKGPNAPKPGAPR